MKTHRDVELEKKERRKKKGKRLMVCVAAASGRFQQFVSIVTFGVSIY